MRHTKMTTQGTEHRFLAGLHSFDAEAKTATFYIMNTSANRNRWGVTDQALEEALPTLKGKPLGMGAGYKIDRHYPEGETIDSGIFTAYEKPGAYALATAAITDPETVAKIKKGELGPVSVVIHSFRDVCSKCNTNLSSEKDFSAHPCIAKADAYAKVESFRFKRVDFVDVPAYPQAGLLELAAKAAENIAPLELLASFYESQAPQALSQEKTEQGNTEQNNEEKSLTDPENQKIAELEKTNQKLNIELEAAVTKAAANEETAKALKAQLDTIVKAQHEVLVTETLAARVKAGIAGKLDDEKTLLTAQTDTTLTLLRADAEKVAALTTNQPAGPLTKYAKPNGTDLEAAMKTKAAQLGFAERKEEA
jgi:hypothetical protein